MHRFPIKIICGLTYFVLKNIGLVVRPPCASWRQAAARTPPPRTPPPPQIMLLLITLWSFFYGWFLHRLTKLSWEWGVTQGWNSIPNVKEARRADPPPAPATRLPHA